MSPVDFNLGTINDAMKPYWSIIDRRQSVPFVIGLFRFIDKDGDERISIDLNIRVHQAFRANTMRFAAANNQISFWDNLTKTCIPTGGNGETILKTRSISSWRQSALAMGAPASQSFNLPAVQPLITSLASGRRQSMTGKAKSRPTNTSTTKERSSGPATTHSR